MRLAVCLSIFPEVYNSNPLGHDMGSNVLHRGGGYHLTTIFHFCFYMLKNVTIQNTIFDLF